MSVHKLIREGRKALGLTHTEFAELCGVSRTAVQQWEDETKGTAPNRNRQAAVAKALGISVSELMSGKGRTEPYSARAMRLAQIFDHLEPERQRIAYAMVQVLANPGEPLQATDQEQLPAAPKSIQS